MLNTHKVVTIQVNALEYPTNGRQSKALQKSAHIFRRHVCRGAVRPTRSEVRVGDSATSQVPTPKSIARKGCRCVLPSCTGQ